ncbi:MAG: hypothetical protein AAF485_12025 [Chloroflexota bacterium]
MIKSISHTILERHTEGVNLQPGQLRDQLGHTPTLIVFLRHIG